VKWLGRGAVGLGLVLLTACWVLALVYAGPRPQGLAVALATAYGVGSLAVLIFLRPFRRAVLVWLGGLAAVLVWWWSLHPTQLKDWQPDVARTPHGEVHGDLLTLRDVRNFDYRSETEYTERWETRTYDLSKLRGGDLFLSYWGSPAIAHTILSWDFEDGLPLAISIETRKDKTQVYSAIAGFFKQYELVYVAADERDLIRLRTNHRGEEVYLYRLTATPERARAILLDYLKTMNALAERPVFYNAFTQNCTTTIRMHTRHVNPGAQPFDWRLLANGYVDQLLYERGNLDRSLPFPELRARSLIVAKAKAADQDPDFSRRIREGLPSPRRGPPS
jgi:hypothetical protein